MILLHKLVTCIHYNALFDLNENVIILFIRSTDGQLVVAVIDKVVPCSVKEEKVRMLTSAAPWPWPNSVTLLGSPLKALMLSWTHWSTARMSIRAWFPWAVLWPVLRNPEKYMQKSTQFQVVTFETLCKLVLTNVYNLESPCSSLLTMSELLNVRNPHASAENLRHILLFIISKRYWYLIHKYI